MLASTAVLAVCVEALLRDRMIGPFPVVLVSLVVASLIFLQAFTLQENTALVASLTSSRTRLTALVENTSDLIVRLRSEMEQILSRHTGQSVERLREDTERDLILSAPDAVAYGVADAVLDSRKQQAVA